MKRYIVIEYDPKKCVDDVADYDLFEQIVDTLDNADIRAKATEYKKDPRK